MKKFSALALIVIGVAQFVTAKTEPSAKPTPKLPKLFHPEGWRSDGQSPDQAIHNQRRDGGEPCDR